MSTQWDNVLTRVLADIRLNTDKEIDTLFGGSSPDREMDALNRIAGNGLLARILGDILGEIRTADEEGIENFEPGEDPREVLNEILVAYATTQDRTYNLRDANDPEVQEAAQRLFREILLEV